MAFVFLTVEGNTAPFLEISLIRRRKPIPLPEGTTAKLIILHPKLKEITNLAHQTCDVTDNEGGKILYRVEDGDLDDPKVDYLSEVLLNFPNGRREIIYEILTIDPRPQLTPPTLIS